ncbi:MAG: hypothetical protein ACOYOU_11880, partial [Kiritimatiellia bacterium]
MFIMDERTLGMLDVNEAALQLYDYAREAFLALTIADIRQLQDVPAVLAAIRRQQQQVQRSAGRLSGRRELGMGALIFGGEWQHSKRDGSVFDVEVTVGFGEYAGRDARLIMVHDITARKQADRAQRNLTAELEQQVAVRTSAMRASAERMQHILEAAHTVAWEADLASEALVESGPVAAFFGKPAGYRNRTQADFLACVHPDDRGYVQARLADALRSRKRDFAYS